MFGRWGRGGVPGIILGCQNLPVLWGGGGPDTADGSGDKSLSITCPPYVFGIKSAAPAAALLFPHVHIWQPARVVLSSSYLLYRN